MDVFAYIEIWQMDLHWKSGSNALPLHRRRLFPSVAITTACAIWAKHVRVGRKRLRTKKYIIATDFNRFDIWRPRINPGAEMERGGGHNGLNRARLSHCPYGNNPKTLFMEPFLLWVKQSEQE